MLSTLCQSQHENGAQAPLTAGILGVPIPSSAAVSVQGRSRWVQQPQETEVGGTASRPSALWGDSSELPALCSKPGQGWVQAKQGESSTQSHPLPKIQPGFALSGRSCTQLLPAESHYFLTSAKAKTPTSGLWEMDLSVCLTTAACSEQQFPIRLCHSGGWQRFSVPSCLQRFCWTAAFCFQPTRAHRDVPAQRQR